MSIRKQLKLVAAWVILIASAIIVMAPLVVFVIEGEAKFIFYIMLASLIGLIVTWAMETVSESRIRK